jgi:hypothetical protein
MQRVGVEQERRLDPLDQQIDEAPRLFVPSETRAEHDGIGATREREHLVGVARAVHHQLGGADGDLIAHLR